MFENRSNFSEPTLKYGESPGHGGDGGRVADGLDHQ